VDYRNKVLPGLFIHSNFVHGIMTLTSVVLS